MYHGRDEVMEAAQRQAFQIIQSLTGLKLTIRGRQAMCRCPYHDDRTASLSIRDDGVFKCHAGGCGATGNIYTLVKDFCHTQKPREFLARHLGIRLHHKKGGR